METSHPEGTLSAGSREGARTIFFMGKPGSGKGTQAKLLSEKTGWPIIGTSGGLRDVVALGGGASRKLQETMDKGQLTPYWLAAYVYLKSILPFREDQGVIFDGGNRTVGESQIILDSLLWLDRPFKIFYLETSDKEVQSRIALRLEKGGRTDDRPEALDQRLKHYYELTDKAALFYRNKGLLTEVNGEGAPEDIAANIRSILNIT